MKNIIKIQINNNLAEMELLSAALEDFGLKQGLEPKFINAFQIAIDELVSNTIFYGYDKNKKGTINLEIEHINDFVRVKIEDDAKPFDPKNAPEPDLNTNADNKKIGGLGVHIVKKIMNRFDYQRKNNKNIVILEKKIV